MKVLITGASGLLGSQVYTAFKKAYGDKDILGLAHSRATGDLKKLDLLDPDAVERLIQDFKPDWLIHCAAERRPDVAEKDVEGTRKLNAVVPRLLALLSARYSYKLVYISTDYVFPGINPPYGPPDPTEPLQLYGETKRDGEEATLGVTEANVVVLRVPVLYGPAPKNSDSAINILLDIVKDQSGKTYKMDHYATRYPTNVVDIASFLVGLSNLDKALPKIMHYSSPEPFTKYEICLIFAAILSIPHNHIIPDADPPKDGVARPRDCQLDVRETEKLLEINATGFEEWWRTYLGVDDAAT